MKTTHSDHLLLRAIDHANTATKRWVLGSLRLWWHGAELCVHCLSLGLYFGSNGARVREQIYQATWPLIAGYSVLTGLLSVVIISIVLAAWLTRQLRVAQAAGDTATAQHAQARLEVVLNGVRQD